MLGLLADSWTCRVKMNEKYTVMTPFGVLNKMFGPQMFSPTSRETLNDKIEMYFHDPSFVPLFVQVWRMYHRARSAYLNRSLL